MHYAIAAKKGLSCWWTEGSSFDDWKQIVNDYIYTMCTGGFPVKQWASAWLKWNITPGQELVWKYAQRVLQETKDRKGNTFFYWTKPGRI